MRENTWTLWCDHSADPRDRTTRRLIRRVEAAGGTWRVVGLPAHGRSEAVHQEPDRRDTEHGSRTDDVLVQWDRRTRAILAIRRRFGSPLPPVPWRPRPTAHCAASLDQVLTEAGHHVGLHLDPQQRLLVERLVPNLLDPGDVPTTLASYERWDAMDSLLHEMSGQPEHHRPRPRPLFSAWQSLAEHGDLQCAPDDREARLPALRTIARRLVRHHDYDTALQLISLVSAAWELPPESGFAALAAHARTSLSRAAAADLVEAARGALAGADRHLDRGDLRQAAELLVIGAGLLLHRDLHAETAHSPLVTDPEPFLSPLRDSRAMARLAGPPSVNPSTATDPSPGPGLRRAVVLPGAYPRFAAPIIEGLDAEPGLEVTVLDPSRWLGSFRTLSLDPHLVRVRLLATDPDLPDELRDPAELSAEVGMLAPALEALRAADLVVVDWADKGAVWATLLARPQARVVVRVHGVEALGLWIHALDWSKVDTVLSVSRHQARLVHQVLAHSTVGRSPLPPVQIVHNVVRLPRVDPPAKRDSHLLGLVGWAKAVKDPLWAVEVLAELRRRGGGWRLRLIGAGFSEQRIPASDEYMRSFQARIEQADVRGAVEFVDETSDVAREVEQLGFILSSSRRESFHLGLVEGVLGGAVPVVREWPFFEPIGSASTHFPPEWVVADPLAAADRIWALRSEADRAEAAAAAAAQVRARFDPDRTQARLVDVILGRE